MAQVQPLPLQSESRMAFVRNWQAAWWWEGVVASGASSWMGPPPGQQVRLGLRCGAQAFGPSLHSAHTQDPATECGDSTRILSLKVEVLGRPAWACLASPAEMPAAGFPSRPKPARLWTGNLLECIPWKQRGEVPGGRDPGILGWCPA